MAQLQNPCPQPNRRSSLKILLILLIVISIVALCAGKAPAGFIGIGIAAFALFASRQLAEKQQWRRPLAYSRR